MEPTVVIDTKKKTMTVTMPLGKPTPSASGKTLVIASTRGNLKTGVKYEGKEITLGLNAYIKNDD